MTDETKDLSGGVDKRSMKAGDKQKLKNANGSLAEIMENLRPFLPAREIHEPEPSREWRIAEECYP